MPELIQLDIIANDTDLKLATEKLGAIDNVNILTGEEVRGIDPISFITIIASAMPSSPQMQVLLMGDAERTARLLQQ